MQKLSNKHAAILLIIMNLKDILFFDTQLYMCTTYSQTNPVYDHLKRLNPETGVQEPQSNT